MSWSIWWVDVAYSTLLASYAFLGIGSVVNGNWSPLKSWIVSILWRCEGRRRSGLLASISHGTGHRQSYTFFDPVRCCGVQKDYACSAPPPQATSCHTWSAKERLEESKTRHRSTEAWNDLDPSLNKISMLQPAIWELGAWDSFFLANIIAVHVDSSASAKSLPREAKPS